MKINLSPAAILPSRAGGITTGNTRKNETKQGACSPPIFLFRLNFWGAISRLAGGGEQD